LRVDLQVEVEKEEEGIKKRKSRKFPNKTKSLKAQQSSSSITREKMWALCLTHHNNCGGGMIGLLELIRRKRETERKRRL